MDLAASPARRGGDTTQRVTNLFLTGPPGAGKSTILFSVLGLFLPRHALGGFVVKRVYRQGRRVAMVLIDLRSQERGVLATFPDPERPHRPEVYPEAFEEVGVPAIRSALAESAVCVMDELGRFELGAPRFLAAVEEALASPVPVVGVLKAESNPFLDTVRRRPDTCVLAVGTGVAAPVGARGGPAAPAAGREAAAASFRRHLARLLDDTPPG